MPDRSVVQNLPAPDEAEFHAAMTEAIGRMIGRFGKPKVAATMHVSIRQLDNILAGAFPRPDRLRNLTTLDADALDPIDRLYGDRRVPRDAMCSTDPVSTKLAMLLTRTIEIEKDDSPGGADATLGELLTVDEFTLRAAATKLAGWVERIDAYRAGEAPRLRTAA